MHFVNETNRRTIAEGLQSNDVNVHSKDTWWPVIGFVCWTNISLQYRIAPPSFHKNGGLIFYHKWRLHISNKNGRSIILRNMVSYYTENFSTGQIFLDDAVQ